jgi:NADH:ubiquinone oxidoreductase subunit 6 (subunit J)
MIHPAAILAVQSHVTEALLFYLFAALTGISALTVVASRNIVRMSVALLFTLSGVTGLFFLLQAEFLAAVQLVVYVGGTLILIVFGVMLTSKSPFTRFEPSKGEVAIAVMLAAVLLATLVLAKPSQLASAVLPANAAPSFLLDSSTNVVRYEPGPARLTIDRQLAPAEHAALLERAAADPRLAGSSDRQTFARSLEQLMHNARALPARQPLDPDAPYPTAGLGLALLGDYLLPFELASVILLAVMIGAAYLAKARRRPQA